MTPNANVVSLAEGKSALVRPRFSPGLLLRDDDLKVGVDYTRELSRLLFRSLLGCGVVCGLRVSAEMECGKLIVTVDSGVALNPAGDPIHVSSPTTVKVDPTCGKDIPPRIWVILCRTEKCCAPRTTVCGCEEEDSASVCTREQEGFEVRLVKEPAECACMCDEALIPDRENGGQSINGQRVNGCWCADPCGCLKDHYAGKCFCGGCDPDCVVLAVLTDVVRDSRYDNAPGIRSKAQSTGQSWLPNHSVRRFVRPVLMRDPVVFFEQTGIENPCEYEEEQEEPPAPEVLLAMDVQGREAEPMLAEALAKKPQKAGARARAKKS